MYSHPAQISRLMRELTRVEAERDKAREDLKGYVYDCCRMS